MENITDNARVINVDENYIFHLYALLNNEDLKIKIIQFINWFIAQKELRFGYYDGHYMLGMSYINFIVMISNAFIKWVNLYNTQNKDSKDWIIKNDLFFNLNTSNEEMSDNEVALIKQIDDAKLTPDKHIETKYGLGTIRNLSSGCKTLLNIVKHPEKVVCVEECGPNVLKVIFAMDNIKIYMSRPSLADIPDDAIIRFNDTDVVTGSAGYNAWWSKEYERREANDL